jgi:hypothetical protein
MTSLLQSHEPISQKNRTVPLECAECGARYIAVLADDPPDWKPHCAARRSDPCGAAPSIACTQFRLNATDPNGEGKNAT